MRILSWILVICILLGLILVYILFEGSMNWTAVAALASSFVLVWAIFQQAIIRWLNRPVITITPYRHEPAFFRPAPELDEMGRQVAKGYYVNLELINKGKSIAYHAQPQVTGFWKLRQEGWCRDKSWMPIGLLWVFDEIVSRATHKPTEEKDLVPLRPYHFNLLKFGTGHPDEFRLLLILCPTAQSWKFSIGEYCFEVTVTAEHTKPFKAYYYINFRNGGCNDDYQSVQKKVHIRSSDEPPN